MSHPFETDLDQVDANFQALSPVWGGAIASLALRRGFKSYSVMALNNDFTKSMVDTFIEHNNFNFWWQTCSKSERAPPVYPYQTDGAVV